jgi:molecular chaperone HscA
MTAGAARILVAFTIDADGLLTVSACEQTTGLEQNVEVKPSYGISEDEMTRMLRDSMEHAKSDMTERLLAEARVDGERVISALGAALSGDGDLCDEADRETISRAVTNLREAIAGTDRDLINARVSELDETSRPFAERRMDRGIRKALEGKRVSELEEEDASSSAGGEKDKKKKAGDAAAAR